MKRQKLLLLLILLFSPVTVTAGGLKARYKLTVGNPASANVRYISFEELQDHNCQDRYGDHDMFTVYRSCPMDSGSQDAQEGGSINDDNNASPVDTVYFWNRKDKKQFCNIEDGIPKIGGPSWQGYLLSKKLIKKSKNSRLKGTILLPTGCFYIDDDKYVDPVILNPRIEEIADGVIILRGLMKGFVNFPVLRMATTSNIINAEVNIEFNGEGHPVVRRISGNIGIDDDSFTLELLDDNSENNPDSMVTREGDVNPNEEADKFDEATGESSHNYNHNLRSRNLLQQEDPLRQHSCCLF